MSQITVDMIAELRKEADAYRNKLEQAKGKLSVIEDQIKQQIDVLASYGVTHDTAEARIAELNALLDENYSNAEKILKELNDDKV